MKYLFLLCCISVFTLLSCGQKPDSIVLRLDSLDEISGHRPEILGMPKIIDSDQGRAIEFDGIGDALVLDVNPLAGFEAFTLEVVFRPDAGGSPEQRFVHLQEEDEHRALIETRLTGDGQWFLDTFLKSGESECTLYAEDHLHPVGKWFHAALVYRDGLMRHYVDGLKELEGPVEFAPMRAGQTSVGSRLNRVYWYKGAVRALAATGAALEPADFVLR